MISGGGNGGVLVELGYAIGAGIYLAGNLWGTLELLLGSTMGPIALNFCVYAVIAMALIAATIIALSDDDLPPGKMEQSGLKLFGFCTQPRRGGWVIVGCLWMAALNNRFE